MNNNPEPQTRLRKFLIVDDHAGFRRILRAFLPAGSVTECASGIEAVALYETEQPDWVLMDIEMAGMDGLTATRHLLHRFPQARVIFVSNHHGEAFRRAAKEAGSRGFVSKEHLNELSGLIEAQDFSDRNP